MKILLMVLALLFCAPAIAQDPAEPAPACSPWAGVSLDVANIDGLYAASWWCRDAADKYAPWRLQRAAAHPVALVDAKLAAVKSAALRQSYPQLLALRDRPITDPLFAPAVDWARSRTPPPGPWTVAANGLSTTRPMRALTGSSMPYALGAELAGRATVGATCDCTKRVISGTSTWCAVGSGAAVCRDAAP